MDFGNENDCKLGICQLLPEDGVGGINIISYNHSFQNSPNRMIEIVDFFIFFTAVKKTKQKKAAFAAA